MATMAEPDEKDHVGPERIDDNNDDDTSVVVASRSLDEEDYGYENTEEDGNDEGPTTTTTRSEQQQRRTRTVSRRNVVKVDEAKFEMSYHPGRVLAYSPPRQRQKWGEAQSLPHVNWGDLFFDLHYVAATYNISYILVYDPTWQGLLYAAGTFFPVQMIWTRANHRSSRFVTEDDLFHRALQICTLVVLATAVLHIRPVKYMSNAAGEISMFVFCLCLCLDDVLEAVKCMEEYYIGVGQKNAVQNASRVTLYNVGVAFLFHVPALIVAALEFFPRSSSNYTRRLADEESSYNDSDNEALYDEETSGYEKSTTNVPIVLILIGYWVVTLSLAIRVIFFFPQNGKHKEIMIPMNIAFFIHRVGEFTMLMLGECVFSLVIVDVPEESHDFLFTFYCSLLAVVFLCYLHYQSQPQVCNHAMRRSKDAGVLWGMVGPIYSFSLVCLGAAFTFFLEYLSMVDGGHRLLAGADDRSSERERSAHLFCGSLAIIFACMDGSVVLHIGLEEISNRLHTHGKRNPASIIVLLLRLAVIPFTATLSQWETEPDRLAMIGLLCVLSQLVVRKLGNIFLVHDDVVQPAAADETADAPPERISPRKFHESVLMASALVNLSESQRQALEGDFE